MYLKQLEIQKVSCCTPVVKITFVKKDAPLALKIREVIQGGTLEYPKNSGYVNLLFQNLDSAPPLLRRGPILRVGTINHPFGRFFFFEKKNYIKCKEQ